MRSAALGLLCLAAAAPLAAQSSEPLFAPFRPNRTPLAATADVPDGFGLFVADPVSQALYNPARLGLRARRGERAGAFLYGTVRPEGSEPCEGASACSPAAIGRPTFSVAGATGGRTRLLFLAEHGGVSDERELTDRRGNQDLSRDDETLRTTTSGRLVAVFSGTRTAYSVGVFGGYRRFHDRSERLSAYEYRSFVSPTDPSYRYDFDRDENTSAIVDEAYGVGVEFGVAGARLDLVGSVSYQGRRQEQRSVVDDREVSERVLPPDSIVLRQEEVDFEEIRFDGDAHAADARLSAALRFSDDPDADALIVEAFGTAGGGDAAALNDRLYRLLVSEDGVPITTEESESLLQDTDLDLRGYGGGGALGYVHRRRLGRAEAVAGVRAEVLAGHRTGGLPIPSQVSTANTRLQPKLDYWQAALLLPLHVEAPVARQLRLFGGGVYGVRYASEDLSYTTQSSSFANPDGSERLGVEREQLATTGRFYLGARLRSKSGFAAQAAFRGSLSDLNRWTVSLGYHF